MSKASSRGYRQTLAKNPSAMPWGKTGADHLRSATDAQDKARLQSHRDNTARPALTQVQALKANIVKIERSIEHKIKNNRPWHHLATLLANQKARAEALAVKAVETLAKDTKPVMQAGLKRTVRILPDVSEHSWRKYLPTPRATAKQQKRFAEEFVNAGKVQRWSWD